MKILNSFIFNNCKLAIKLFLLLICGFWVVCCQTKEKNPVFSSENQKAVSSAAINLNSASIEQLKSLPNIGPKTAQKIIEYREHYGKFHKTEHLLLVEGISSKDFRDIKNLIKVE